MFLNKIRTKYVNLPFGNFIFTSLYHTEQFVPKNNLQPDTDSLLRLRDFIDKYRRLFVVTGAGISTESGIRDYRSEGVGLYAVSQSRPIQHQDFVNSLERRRHYWARNYVGWPIFSSHSPNNGHYALTELEKIGKVHWTVTQNVDSLHSKAGLKKLTELHGCGNRVTCLSCGTTIRRDDFQRILKGLNSNWHVSTDIAAPDGDVFLSDDLARDFHIPDCDLCGGILKPDVVFFGDNVPTDRVKFVHERLKESDAVLVLGSSLQVYSAYRFMIAAHKQGKELAIINIGPTRADDLATLKVQAKIGEIIDILYSCVEQEKSKKTII